MNGTGKAGEEMMVRSGKGQRHFCPVSDSTRPGVLHPGALLLEQHESECICSHKDQPLLMPTACTTTEGCTTLLPWPSEMDRGRSHKPGSHEKRAGGQRKSSPTALLSSRQKNVSWETQKSDGDRAQCSPWGFPLLPAAGLWVASPGAVCCIGLPEGEHVGAFGPSGPKFQLTAPCRHEDGTLPSRHLMLIPFPCWHVPGPTHSSHPL